MPRLLPAAALACVLVAVLPVLRVGFLADDHALGARLAEVAREEPGILQRGLRGLTRPWSPALDAYRPLTVLSVDLDHALLGTDGCRHHLTNMLLWLGCAAAFAALAVRVTGRREPQARALALLLFGLWPAAVEGLGWLVARDDLLVTLFGLLAIWALLRWPGRPWLSALAVGPALLAKETALVLLLLVPLADLLLVRGGRPSRARGWRPLPVRHLPLLLVGVAYLGARGMVFGHPLGRYLGSGPEAVLASPAWLAGALQNGLRAVEMLVLPVNRSFNMPWVSGLCTGLAAGWILLLLGAARRLHRQDLPVVVLGLAWTLLALLPPLPFVPVGRDLQGSRTLALPAAGLLLPVALLLHRGLAPGRRLAPAGAVLLLAAAGAAMRLDLVAFQRASQQAETVREDLEAVPDGHSVVLLNVEGGNGPRAFKWQLDRCHGAPVLGLRVGLDPSQRPPFRPAPGVAVTSLAWDALKDLPEALAPERAPRTLLARMVRDPRGGRVRVVLVHAGPVGPVPRRLEPGPAGRLVRSNAAFRVELAPTGPHPKVLRLEVRDPFGGVAVARLGAEGAWRAGGLRVPGSAFEPPLSPALLAKVPVPLGIWWVEGYAEERLVLRSPPRCFRLD